MTPFFSPGPIDHPDIPIWIAGVNTGLARLCGEVCDGFHVHPFHTAGYLRDVLRPAIAEGAARAGRDAGRIEIGASVFACLSEADRDFARMQISFYASTPSYRPVLAHHGWGEVGEKLSALAARGEWGAMPGLIDDAMLATFAVSAPSLPGLAAALKERYAGLLDRVTVYRAFTPGMEDEAWRQLAIGLA
jgi:probable F420-dependent oxidoreductase